MKNSTNSFFWYYYRKIRGESKYLKLLAVREEVREYFSKVKWGRLSIIFFAMLFFFPYEILRVTENFLYAISFVVFLYHLVGLIKLHILKEFDMRYAQIRHSYLVLSWFRRRYIKRLLSFLYFVETQDLELISLSLLNAFNLNIAYSAKLSNDFNTFNFESLDSAEFDNTLLQSNSFAEVEELTFNYFD